MSAQLITSFSFLIFGLVSFGLFWLHVDALAIRFEIKTFLKAVGFGVLGVVLTLNFLDPLIEFDFSQISIWLTTISFYLIFLSFVLDPHSKLQFLIVVAIIIIFFLKEHALLAVQAALISTTVLRLAHQTKHNDLISFGVGFVFIAVAEFFLAISQLEQGFKLAAGFLYIFASVTLFYWLWQYLITRFNLKRIAKMIKSGSNL